MICISIVTYDVKEPSEIAVSEIVVNGVYNTEHTTVTVCAHVLSVLYLLSFGLRGSPSLPVSFFCTLKKGKQIYKQVYKFRIFLFHYFLQLNSYLYRKYVAANIILRLNDTGVVIDSEPHRVAHAKQRKNDGKASCLLHWLSMLMLAVPLFRFTLC